MRNPFNIKLFAFLFIANLVILQSFAYSSDTEHVTIVDTDMGLDDVRAILALLADSEIAPRAIITVEGSASIGKGTDNLIGLLEEFGAGEVHVYRGAGYPDIEPPPWRGTANSLAGNPFPPPRAMTAAEGGPDRLHALVADSHEEVTYLALGPLRNLALLEKRHPGSVSSLDAVWMPVSIKNGKIDAWNLSFDIQSAAVVIENARSVVLVDITAARTTIDAATTLDSVHGSSVAARWISGHAGSLGPHLMIYDELAVLALMRPGMLQTDPERYSLAVPENGELHLEQAPDGNIRVARFFDHAAAAEELVHLWEREHETRHDHLHLETVEPSAFIKAFHGHLGPYLVLGYRMGKMALSELDSPGHFGLSVVVHSVLEPPKSCLIDGIQLGSGCTLGKRNIEVTGMDGPAYAVFTNDHGLEVTIRLREDVPGLIGRLIEESGVEQAGTEIMDMSSDDLFEITRPASPPVP